MADNSSTGALDDLIGSLKSAVAPFRTTLQGLHEKYINLNEGKVPDAVASFEQYLKLAPRGQFAGQAKAMLAQLKPPPA